jgi:hypothetical protein
MIGDLRMVSLVLMVGLGLVAIAGALPPTIGYVTLIGACLLLGWGLPKPVRNTIGLRQHRQ